MVDVRFALDYYNQSYPASLTGGGSTGPHIAGLTPTNISTGSLTTVTVTGHGFEVGSSAEVDGAGQTTAFVSATELTFDTTPATAKLAFVSVRNLDSSESNSVPLTIQDDPPTVQAEQAPTETDLPADDDEPPDPAA